MTHVLKFVTSNTLHTHFLSFHAEQKVETQHDVSKNAASEEGGKDSHDTEGGQKVETQHDISENAASKEEKKELHDTEGWRSSNLFVHLFLVSLSQDKHYVQTF